MEVLAPAKINLYLTVKGKMDDGYHEIETIFERISLFDHIFADISEHGTSIECDHPLVPTGDTSLLGKTISSFKAVSGTKKDFKVILKKNIPVAAGLGGGSSDAASLLKALNGLVGEPLTKKELIEIARPLGADVPFFLEDNSFAMGSGRGDMLKKIGSDINLSHILINPPFEVSTREVYARVSAFSLTKDRGIDRMMSAFSKEKDINIIIENLRNDLQAIVLRDFPVIGEMLSALNEAGAAGSLVSGSGPTVFGLFEDEHIEQAGEIIRKRFADNDGWKVYTARTY